ncbi:MAG: putative glycosyltransferase [Chthonomonadales bacterium]|nr:putative glycosyltransferase [Chthonomonadales bacterium]
MPDLFETALLPTRGPVFLEPVRIYTGILGQIGDIVAFTPTVRRIKELFPNSQITFAVSERYREAGELVAGLPYVDRLFVTKQYFEQLTDDRYFPWHLGWPVNLCGDDEVVEQYHHDIVLETRPRHRRMPWWEYAHMSEEFAHMVGVPGPIVRQAEIRIPPGTLAPAEAHGKIVLHNDPDISSEKQWPWESVERLVQRIGAENVVLLGKPGPEVAGTLDLRGKTSLAEAASIIAQATCYVGIDSGLMHIAGSLQAPVVGLYATAYIAAYDAIYPENPNALYLQSEGVMGEITPGSVEASVKRILRTGRRARS